MYPCLKANTINDFAYLLGHMSRQQSKAERSSAVRRRRRQPTLAICVLALLSLLSRFLSLFSECLPYISSSLSISCSYKIGVVALLSLRSICTRADDDDDDDKAVIVLNSTRPILHLSHNDNHPLSLSLSCGNCSDSNSASSFPSPKF